MIDWTPEKIEKVKELINDFVNEHQVTCAESVIQCDAPNMGSIELVGEIVDVIEPWFHDEDY